LIESLAFIPTFRKTIIEPFSENLVSWNIGYIKSLLSVFALSELNFLTLTYPLFMLFISLFFVLFMIYFRNKENIRNSKLLLI
jgi:hypothetical protein